MGKKTWLIITLFIAVIFIGYGYTKRVEATQYYNNAMNAGAKTISDASYHRAENHFRNALKKKPNDSSANAHLEQLEEYQKGLTAIKNQDYSKAIVNFKKVTKISNGSQTLLLRAVSKEIELKEVVHELKIFNKTYKRAKVLATNYEYTASNTKLAVILGYGNITQSYYQDIRKKARNLEHSNNQVLARLGYNVSSADESSEKKVATDILPTISSSPRDSSSSANPRKITSVQIKQARKEIASQGIDVKAFSDADVKEVIEHAREQNMSVSEVAREFK
ncbi:hypothetical protein [Liquorilactobacillus mali]|uniref:Uncharacterized protein n=1 Tax=Liquorilactobacillus mali KCTC 3596 = DSM 20444 TaxID=1046596 RepID=A0A0R2DZE8_9LACO|nr:hypothetical protein [Liquorilactobacillus mali]KRN08726.1 hypothetical protein FD00_GL001938 [Liquorilactobacillus mali KCTC 3596 = DSM 20444]MDC7953336.1 hypothetical protein [Liquorilactobacillus mali]QFQ75460.1 hypothetical protein LM596_10310 [Liquorilactobacillus mali]